MQKIDTKLKNKYIYVHIFIIKAHKILIYRDIFASANLIKLTYFLHRILKNFEGKIICCCFACSFSEIVHIFADSRS